MPETFLEPIVWYEFFINGGPVVLALFAVAFLLWFLIVERLIFIKREFPKRLQKVLEDWQVRHDKCSWNAHKIRESIISESRQSLERGVSTIRILIALCPLLGLLGTVTGMLGVFEVISLTGNSDAKAMGAGIYKATLPTMVGLFLALSAIYFNHSLQQGVKSRLDQLTDQLTIFHHAPKES